MRRQRDDLWAAIEYSKSVITYRFPSGMDEVLPSRRLCTAFFLWEAPADGIIGPCKGEGNTTNEEKLLAAAHVHAAAVDGPGLRADGGGDHGGVRDARARRLGAWVSVGSQLQDALGLVQRQPRKA